MNRPDFCEAPEPHLLRWLTEDFAVCPECELLYALQPGALVWVYDPWSVRLAWRLADALLEAELSAAGLTSADLLSLQEGVTEPSQPEGSRGQA